MSVTNVDRLYKEFRDLVSYLDKAGEPSLRSVVDENFRKSLLLAAASYFEDRITNDLLLFIGAISNDNQLLIEFVKNKGVKRQYHTFFKWDERNANQFFGLFGGSFSAFMKNQVKSDDNLDNAIKAFLEIGNDRNRLIHQNFATFSLEKTADEIYNLYKAALPFVDSLHANFQKCPM